MKKTVNIFFRIALLSGAMLATMPSCDVLQQDPPTAFESVEEAFSNAARVELSMVGVYNDLQNLEFLGGRALIYSDIRSGDTDPTSYFGNVGPFTMLSTDAFARDAWAGGYRTIFGANSFIQNLTAYPNAVSEAQRNTYFGEAKFIRAMTMLHLVNLFGQPYNFTPDASHPGIVLQLTAPKSSSEAFDPALRQPRASVREVYDQMERDLIDAIAALPVAPAGSRVTRASKGAAQALLARVYLYKGDYAKAADFANQVITSNRYSLNANPFEAFGLSATGAISAAPVYITPENIFSVQMNTADNPNTNNAIGQHYGAARRGDITITPFQNISTAIFPIDDKRRTLIRTTGTGANIAHFTNKFNAVDNWVPLIRYPEVLLTRAEALVRSTNTVTQEAVNRLNQVRDRSKGAAQASYTLASFTTPQSFVDAVLTERRLELAFEGFRLPDLLRNRQGVPARGGVNAIPYGDSRLVFPIPFQQTQLNPNLVQNTDY